MSAITDTMDGVEKSSQGTGDFSRNGGRLSGKPDAY
jgi:hypothetical protein